MAERPAYLKPEDGALLTSHDADYMVEQLKVFEIEQVGSIEWLAQHEALNKLNLQAHYNTMAHNDEFVMGALISHDKMGVLMHELLVIEIWMEKIFPILLQNVTEDISTMPLSLAIHHEASITNLLEVIMFHQDACEAMGSESLLELADYCYRKLMYLNTEAHKDKPYKERSAKDFINMSFQEEILEKVTNARFQAGMCALTILRYLSDYINALPLCIMARLIDKHDVIMSLVPLVENPPWKRERRKGDKLVVEKYVEGKWMGISKEDHFKVTKSDAQVWLTLYNLIMDPSCRSRFKYTDFHRDQVLKVNLEWVDLMEADNTEKEVDEVLPHLPHKKSPGWDGLPNELRKHLNEILHDQIPILKELQWVLEEISLHVKPKFEGLKSNPFILEQVPLLREKVLVQRNWDHIAKCQLLTTFSRSQLSEGHVKELLRMFEFAESMEAPNCAACGAPSTQRCSRCKGEWYCGKACQKKLWTIHRKICDILKAPN